MTPRERIPTVPDAAEAAEVEAWAAKAYGEMPRRTSAQKRVATRRRKDAYKRVKGAADDLEAAIAASRRHSENLANCWRRSGGVDAMNALRREASKLVASGRGVTRKAMLLWLTGAVLSAYHQAGKNGLGITHHPVTDKISGPVLDAVTISIGRVGARSPSASTIKKAALEVLRSERERQIAHESDLR